jgi:hydroxymethylglutaryl-CoA lyase
LWTALPERASIYEVSLRDGLQNEQRSVPTAAKLELAEALFRAGLKRVELTSFVSPKWVPQLADAEDVAKRVSVPEGVTLSALVPNAHGFERARSSGLREIAVFLSASETHNRKNTRKSIERSLETFREIVPPALESGMRVRAYVSTVWGCPYEGEIDPKVALDIALELLALGCYQVSLGDTIGVGTPLQTAQICELFLNAVRPEQVALHLHDTRGQALANALVGLSLGITHFDAAIGGLGGCPYAPGAAGNLATEDLVYMLEGMGVATGVDLDALIEAGKTAERVVGRPLPGKVHQAGRFQRRSTQEP